MSQLSDAINKAAEAAMSDDGFDASVEAGKLWDELDGDDQKTVGLTELARRLKSAADAVARRALKTLMSAQGELPFSLPGAVAMDVEGHKVKPTRALLEHEFKRAIEIRRKQLKADEAILKEFEAAERAFRPIWLKNPDWTAGQCLDAIMARPRAKKAS